MARAVIIGGGVVGLGLGMMLARDGHDVVQLERDAQPPPAQVEEAWERWERRGVTQFRLGHFFLPRWRAIVEAELPDLLPALVGAGALRTNPLLQAPAEFRGEPRPGDERYEAVTGRRVVVEKVVAELAAATPGLEVRRGEAVTGLSIGPPALPGVPHVTGVRTDQGSSITSDVVIDASGRRSAVGSWMAAAGQRPPLEDAEDCGFVYYGRHYRSEDGSLPVPLGGALQNYGSISSLTLGADNGHWTVILVARADDVPLRFLRDTGAWERVVRSLPTVAHWIDGQPVEERVVLMSKIEDRIRHLRRDGRPLATGLLLVGDAWACTYLSLGRGASIGMMQAVVARDCLAAAGSDGEMAEAYAAASAEVVEPWYQATVAFDRARLDEMGRIAGGASPADSSFAPPQDDGGAPGGVPEHYAMARAMDAAMLKDPDCFRASLDILFVQELPSTVLDRPGLRDKVLELGASWRDDPALGPDRRHLVAMADGS